MADSDLAWAEESRRNRRRALDEGLALDSLARCAAFWWEHQVHPVERNDCGREFMRSVGHYVLGSAIAIVTFGRTSDERFVELLRHHYAHNFRL